ncbi:MAG: aldehyde dehydrogenase family protein [Acidobacteria bacterium]|nr:MAG: aldehyde dehydrogenase family protein [Acidobacteriota bacterium]REK02066.1 MAG: aldehyde dehydrogenase family protein [Acidobacteriota bacterium]REK15024.1 MAG: aldehyde dehydrogenase family protein [Acidobacteriota bacterium]REK45738.1 MAG: aldehyde dehydrogenase family protein [Acidobacteriota bacterium]
MIRISNYIDGRHAEPSDGAYIDDIDPSIGEKYAEVPDSPPEDIDAAVSAARDAFPDWSTASPEFRHDQLIRLSIAIEDNLDRLARAECVDNGKPLSLACSVDIPRAVSNFKFYATAAMQFASESHSNSGSSINYTLRQPIGVVGCISPWNLPLYLFTWKIAPALAAGNCVVAKPSEITPMTAFLLSELCSEAGFPEGVLNIVHGTGPKTGAAIVKHPDIGAISFTGGTKTGEWIASEAAPNFKKLSLELGGKNPNIIFADCDYEEMLETTVRSSFANQGQICLCGSRVFVEQPIYERFRDDFVRKIKALVVGDPLESGTNVGAVVSKPHMEKVLSYIDLAKEEGGSILTGGERVTLDGRCENGYFLRPTVIEGLAHDCRTNLEEIFGPVVTIMPFEDEEEVIGYANTVRYGLSSTVWTSDLSRAHRVAERLEAGIVWVNCWLLRDLRTPFGGVKDSGMGREGGFEALRFFTEEKNVCIKYGD